MAEQTFTVYTEPHRATIGAATLEFEPEPETAVTLERMAVLARELNDVSEKYRASAAAEAAETDDDAPAAPGMLPIEQTAAGSRESTDALRRFLRSFMTEASAEEFDHYTYPDRVLQEVQRWLLEVYGLRPTTSSSDSPATPSTTETTGDASTGDSPSAG